MAALKTVDVSDIPNLDQLPDKSCFYSTPSPRGGGSCNGIKIPKFAVIGHRGNGMNMLNSSDTRMKLVKENSVLSFNTAATSPLDFVEFDVQVTKDGCPVIFHDDFILSQENGTITEKRVTDLSLSEFLAYGPQSDPTKTGKSLVRKTKEGKVWNWNVESDAPACTLQEVFQQVKPCVGFNIEVKFDDHILYQKEYLVQVLQTILQVVFKNAKDRPVIFSSFHPDAALLLKKFQSTYPVFFLTNGGTEYYNDVRRNSLEEALKLCLEGGLEGIVSEVKGVFRNPAAASKIKESNLSLLTYGKLNNVPEAVYMQYLMGIEGVIVDLVQVITEAVSEMIKPKAEDEEMLSTQVKEKPEFTQRELSFLLKLIPELIQV
ncbi:hypothetical protein AgCh_025040 [Apium graveolens]